MQAWKFYYTNVKNIEQRYIVGIVANSRDDALMCLKQHVKFEFSVDRTEYLGDIHALSAACERMIAQSVNRRVGPVEQTTPAPKPTPQPAEIKLEEDEEVDGVKNEIECKFCGRICNGAQALAYHENRCEKNPDSIKKQKTKKEKK